MKRDSGRLFRPPVSDGEEVGQLHRGVRENRAVPAELPKTAACLTVAAVVLSACGGVGDVSRAQAEVTQPGCSRYCLVVEPASGPPGTLFTFHGHGWRPRVPVEALYGMYCDYRPTPPGEPEAGCPRIGLTSRIPVDARGGFVFRFRHGPKRLLGDSGSGAGPPVFEQWRGRAYRSHLIRREPEYKVTMPEPQS
jgi:hypothetical protein